MFFQLIIFYVINLCLTIKLHISVNEKLRMIPIILHEKHFRRSGNL